jgi:hypothetical protein
LNRLRKLLVLLAVAVAALALSGCVTLSGTGSFQVESMGPVTLSVSGCSSGSPGCAGETNTGSIYELMGSQDVDVQLLLAVRLPDGSAPPANLIANLTGGGFLPFARSTSYEAELQALEPAPAGERWWGWLSSVINYSQTSKQGFNVQLTATLPRPADGGPFESPMRWRPVLGARVAEGTYLPGRAVKCGTTNKDLYEGFEEPGGSGESVICIDAPSPAATRGFVEAALTDFGIIGTTVQAPPGSTVTAPFIAKRSGPASPGVTFTLSAQGGVPGGTLAIDRTTASLGGDATQPVLAMIGVPADAAAGSYPVTLTAAAPGKPTRTGTVTVVVPNLAPEIKEASLSHKRFRGKKPKKGVKGGSPVGTKLNVELSEAATLSIQVLRKGKGKRKVMLGTLTKSLPKGKSTISFRSRIGNVKLKPGHYWLTLIARDSSGLGSESKTLGFDFAS